MEMYMTVNEKMTNSMELVSIKLKLVFMKVNFINIVNMGKEI